ncbi:uncharacterized protein LOC143209527 [Lasioglossum baleicum]|uniref:uncharacterized protein LOC143209527 n=1 Tax=Lasioglossum baleicum TaxID=434251 RepID=UPI003FCE8514
MELNNFEKLTLQARQIDTGIEHLNKIWSKPDIFIGRFVEDSEETNVHIEALWNSIHSIQKRIEKTTLEVDKYTEDLSTEHTLQETRKTYELLKEQCDNIELIFEQYGYQYDNNDTSDQQSTNSTNISEQEIVEKATKTLEVEFTPDLSWKCKANQMKQSTSISNISNTPNSMISPIPENSTSVLKDYLSTPIICTPFRERPREPFYSKHFYESLKK